MRATFPRIADRFRGQPADSPTLDLGDGKVLSASDVLDSHFQRMARAHPHGTVPAQHASSLQPAITVLAPELAPLTDLAEDLADAVTDVQPDTRFRSDLQRALEQTHRQHAAQRQLGTRQPAPSETAASERTLLMVLGLLFVTMMLLVVRRTKRLRRA